jgi:dTDP-glucose 4,6-dehydratase
MRLNDGRAAPNFIRQALAGDPLTVYGDGSQTRSLCYVDDLVEGILTLLHTDYSDPVNIGNPAEVTILELANLIRELCSSNSEIAYKPLPEDDPKQRRPDITRARTLLHWSPRTDLGVGLEQTIASFRQR